MTFDEHLRETVSEVFEVPWNKIEGKSRDREIVAARHTYCSLSRLLTRNTLKKIGNNIGGRDHSTVMHAVTTIRGFYKTNDPIVGMVEKVKDRLLSKTADHVPSWQERFLTDNISLSTPDEIIEWINKNVLTQKD